MSDTEYFQPKPTLDEFVATQTQTNGALRKVIFDHQDHINNLQKQIVHLTEHVDYLAAWSGAEFPDEVESSEKEQPSYPGQKLVQALANFYDAAVHVSREFEAIGDQEIYLDDPAGSYPFNEAFEDLLPQIGKWVEAVDAELKENYPRKEETK